MKYLPPSPRADQVNQTKEGDGDLIPTIKYLLEPQQAVLPRLPPGVGAEPDLYSTHVYGARTRC